MNASIVPMLCYWRARPQGKMRRRLQDVRIPLSSRPTLDLSHNESTRLAMDSLLSQGLEGYNQALKAEAEVDFLSELEKTYILENGRDRVASSDLGASGDDQELKSLSTVSQYTTQCSVMSRDSDRFVTGLDLSSLTDARTDCVLDEPKVEAYFPSDCGAAGMKDTVRVFIRKSTMALAMVMDSFSDVELLCDFLEASRKRNVSIHLLLDHLNLNQFISMWQDLKLDSMHFPKLSVRSVEGQTYCTKTGRKLTGQIAETFIISDWTEVLTGSFSFSWLSWQVHRNVAVLVKGSAVVPFHQEFCRLYSRSKPVPGFATYISVLDTLALYTTLRAAQNGDAVAGKLKSHQTKTVCHRALKEGDQKTQTVAKTPLPSNLQNSESESSKGDTQPPHAGGTNIHMNGKPHHLYQKPLVEPGKLLSICLRKQEYAFKAPFTKGAAQTNVESGVKNDAYVSCIQPQLANLTIRGVHESNPLHTAAATHGQHRTVGYQSPFRTDSNVCTESLFSQRGGHRPITHLGIAAGPNAHGRHGYGSPNLKPMGDFVSDHPKLLPPSTPQTGLLLHLAHPKGQSSGIQSNAGTRRQDQPQSHHHQSHLTTAAPGKMMKSSPVQVGTLLKHQLHSESQLLSPGPGTKLNLQPPTSQQVKATPRPNWIPRSPMARPRPATHQNPSAAPMGRDSSQFHRSMNTLLGRSKSMTFNSAGIKGADVTPNMN